MGIKTKFYIYLIVTIVLSPLLLLELSAIYSQPNAVDILLTILILLVFGVSYLSSDIYMGLILIDSYKMGLYTPF